MQEVVPSQSYFDFTCTNTTIIIIIEVHVHHMNNSHGIKLSFDPFKFSSRIQSTQTQLHVYMYIYMYKSAIINERLILLCSSIEYQYAGISGYQMTQFRRCLHNHHRHGTCYGYVWQCMGMAYNILTRIHVRMAFHYLPRDQSNNRHHTLKLMVQHTLDTGQSISY